MTTRVRHSGAIQADLRSGGIVPVEARAWTGGRGHEWDGDGLDVIAKITVDAYKTIVNDRDEARERTFVQPR